MRLPGPFEIHRVVEFEWPAREPGFLLRGVDRPQILATRTGPDARFVDPATGLLIMAFHMIVPVPMYSLKFEHWRLRGNLIRYLLLLLAIVILASMGLGGLPIVILVYILLSLLNLLLARNVQ